MKKLLCSLSALVLSLTSVVSAFAATPTVYVDGEKLVADVEPFIEEDRTMVPMRAIFEAVGASVTWDQDTQTVISIKNDEATQNVVVLQIGNTSAFVNSESVALDVPAKVINDRTFVPLRFVMESLDANVDWNPDTFTVTVTTK